MGVSLKCYRERGLGVNRNSRTGKVIGGASEKVKSEKLKK